jgi:hypothetical protein
MFFKKYNPLSMFFIKITGMKPVNFFNNETLKILCTLEDGTMPAL